MQHKQTNHYLEQAKKLNGSSRLAALRAAQNNLLVYAPDFLQMYQLIQDEIIETLAAMVQSRRLAQ